jgi:hypothetical protein
MAGIPENPNSKKSLPKLRNNFEIQIFAIIYDVRIAVKPIVDARHNARTNACLADASIEAPKCVGFCGAKTDFFKGTAST